MENNTIRTGTIVQAVPAIGNTGQLAMDLLIAHLGAQHAAILETVNVLPVVGNDAVAFTRDQVSGHICNSIDLFHVASGCGTPLFLLQQRGPVATGRQAVFAHEFAEWTSAAGFQQVLLLSSVDAAMRRDREICGAQVVFLPGGEAGGVEEALERAGVPRYEEEAGSLEGWRKCKCAPWCALLAPLSVHAARAKLCTPSVATPCCRALCLRSAAAGQQSTPHCWLHFFKRPLQQSLACLYSLLGMQANK
jgi:hypothetical protein